MRGSGQVKVTRSRAWGRVWAGVVLVAALLGATAVAVAQSGEDQGSGSDGLCDAGSVEQFADVTEGDYGAAYVLCMRAVGLSVGTGDGAYQPGRELNRAEVAAFLVRLWRDVLGRSCPSEPAHAFVDTAGSWATGDIACLYALGVTRGTTATTYGPDEPVRATQISRFLYRLHNKTGAACPDGAAGDDELQAAAACLAALRVLPDRGEGSTGDPVTRAQMGVYMIGLWHNLTGRGLPPAPPAKPTTGTETATTAAPTYTAVTAGGGHSCGLRTDNTITCWGANDTGQTDPPSGSFTAVTAGGAHTCGVRTDNTITCWGANESGQTDPPSERFTAVAAGGVHTCGLRTDGAAQCWGGQPYLLTGSVTSFTAVAAGGFHSCGLLTDNTITCWGNNDTGQTDAPSGSFTAVTAGWIHTCGLRTNGAAICWGAHGAGQSRPPSGSYTAVTAGAYHTCGLLTDNTITCWGNNDTGQTDAPSGSFTAVTAGWYHTCGLRTNGAVECWGSLTTNTADPSG